MGVDFIITSRSISNLKTTTDLFNIAKTFVSKVFVASYSWFNFVNNSIKSEIFVC